MINQLAKKIYQANIKKGFYEDEKNIGEMLCLIHSEVSEALECDRKDKYLQSSIEKINEQTKDEDFQSDFLHKVKDTFEDELADIMIRVMDLAAHKGVDLEAHIQAKMRYNAMRPFKHGKKY